MPGYVNDKRRHKLNKKIAEMKELNTHTNEIMRVVNIERQSTKNAKMAAAALRNKTYQVALDIKAKMKALKQAERSREGLKKANAAATRANIIRRIKGARGRKHMSVH